MSHPIIQKLQTLPLEESLEVSQNILKELYKSSLYKTAKNLLGYKDINWRTHGAIIKALESETKRKLICVPRGCFKSSIGVISYSIWKLLAWPNLRILIDSEIYKNSKNSLREIKGLLLSEKFIELFGEWRMEESWNEAEIITSQRTKIFKEASITCGGIDTEKTGQHYDLIICDDMNGQSNSQTQDQREKVIKHYQMSMAILEPEGTMVVIGTRWAEDDLIGWILANEL